MNRNDRKKKTIEKSTPGSFEKKFKSLIDSIIRPILSVLISIGATPNRISNTRLLIGVIGISLITIGNTIPGAILILISLALDSFDGGIARRLKQSSHRGTFIDRVCDYTIYCGTIITTIFLEQLSSFSGSYHLFIFLSTSILRAVALNEGARTDWIIDPRANIVWSQIAWYLSFFTFALTSRNFLDQTIFWLNLFLTLTAIQSYFTIQERWYGTPSKRK